MARRPYIMVPNVDFILFLLIKAFEVIIDTQMLLLIMRFCNGWLQVIIIFTDGEFALNSTVTLPETQLAPSVKVFIYKLPPPNDGDIFLSNNSLLSSLCRIGGTFEVIEQDITNPLYAIRSYFSYLASAQMASQQVQGKPLWTSPYQNRDVVGGYITTVTYPGKSKEPNSVFLFSKNLLIWESFLFTRCKTFEEA